MQESICVEGNYFFRYGKKAEKRLNEVITTTKKGFYEIPINVDKYWSFTVIGDSDKNYVVIDGTQFEVDMKKNVARISKDEEEHLFIFLKQIQDNFTEQRELKKKMDEDLVLFRQYLDSIGLSYKRYRTKNKTSRKKIKNNFLVSIGELPASMLCDLEKEYEEKRKLLFQTESFLINNGCSKNEAKSILNKYNIHKYLNDLENSTLTDNEIQSLLTNAITDQIEISVHNLEFIQNIEISNQNGN